MGSEVLAAVWVVGIPRTKGSLDRRMQDTPQSKAWRHLVKAEIERDMRVRGTATCIGPVAVRCVFVRRDGIGDVDKLARNVLDALTDSRVIGDDAQVVKLHCDRVERAGARRGEGALVVVSTWAPIDNEERATREIDSWWLL